MNIERFVKTVQEKYEIPWVRKTVVEGTMIGTIVGIYLNNARPAGVKGTIKWTDGTID